MIKVNDNKKNKSNKFKLLKDGSAKNFFKCFKNRIGSLPKKAKEYLTYMTVIPLIVLFINIFVLTPMYTSEAKFAVRTISSTNSGVDFASLILKVPSISMQDARILEEYLKSPDVLYELDKKLNIIDHYSNDSYDFFSRLSKNYKSEDLISFWRDRISVKVNTDSGVVTISVESFKPEISKKIVETVLVLCEVFINGINERANNDDLLMASSGVKAAKEKFDIAQNALKDFRNKYKDLDLKTTATGLQSVIIDLEGQATSVRTQLSEVLAYMQKDAPSVKALRTKLLGIERQLEIEKQKVTSLSTTGDSINTLAGVYETLTIDVEFAKKQLEYAMATYEKAKIEVTAKNLYVVNISNPSLPEEPSSPKPFRDTFYFFVALNFVYFFCFTLMASLKEHLGFNESNSKNE